MIDPNYWQGMQPFAQKPPVDPNAPRQGGTDPNRYYASGAPGQQVYTTQGQQGGPDPYASVIEAQQRLQKESDRDFQLRKSQLDQQKQQIAIQRGQAEAQAWYNRELIKLSQEKLTEDKRQFDLGAAESTRQFNEKTAELARQFDLTTEEGRRQFDWASHENQRQFSSDQALRAGMFDQTTAETKRQFDVTSGFNEKELAERMRQYDLTTEEGRRQFNATLGFNEKELGEKARQFDITTEVGRQQFAASLAEESRQYNVGASGYMDNGQATLAREQFGNSALFDWTKEAINLASTPADWVKYKQMTSGVAANAGEIPGLAWTQGGQQGNTAFQGQAQSNSLGNVLGQMGVAAPGGGGITTGQGFIEQGAPADPRGAAAVGGPYGGFVPAAQGGSVAPGRPADGTVAPGQAGAPVQQPTNWAYQAAGMIPTGDALKAKLSGSERQLYETANEFARNPQGAASGWYEQQDPMTKELLRGAAQAQGHDWETAMSRYNKSRWGGGGSSMAA